MPDEIEKTFHFLARSGNAAATPVLLAALRSEAVDIRDAALDALLQRSSRKAEAYLADHWHELPEAWRLKIKGQCGGMTSILRERILSNSRVDCQRAAAIALEIEDFDLVRPLTVAAEDQKNENRDIASKTLTALVDRLRKLLDAATDERKRNLALCRSRAMETLEDAMRRCATHRSEAIVESFLMLTQREHPRFRHLFDDAASPASKMSFEIFQRTLRPALIRLLLGTFQEGAPSPTLLSVAAWRSDAAFVTQLLDFFSGGMSEVELRNLKKITHVGWCVDQSELLAGLTGRQQATALRFLNASGQERESVFAAVRFLLQAGKPEGRLAAVEALANDRGAVANQWIIEATGDEDPEVAAAALRQLRQRGIPGSLKYLLAKLDSEHEEVRSAVRQSLEEFSFAKYLAAFDLMSEDRRESTGQLVRKIDERSDDLLKAELLSELQSRRRRAIEVVECLGIAPQMEGPLLQLLDCDDYLIRVAAAEALTQCGSQAAIAGLREALLDRNLRVQEAAEASLQAIAGRRQQAERTEAVGEKTTARDRE